MKKIAFLFLIYDTINLEELWFNFFNNVDKNKYTIYIHYKTNTPLQYFEQYKLKHIIETKHAELSVVRAQIMLLKEALQDENNEHFIFISGSCIPFKNFAHVYSNLSMDKSYFNIAPHQACFPRCDALLPYMNENQIQKSSLWCILNRKHSKLMVDNKMIELYNNVYAPDEIYFITTIFNNNLQDELITTPNVSDVATTFTNWKDMEYKFPYIIPLSELQRKTWPPVPQIKNYSTISDDEIMHLINSDCFFGRKFNRECISCFCKSFYINSISTATY
jgi:hypothetical protein